MVTLCSELEAKFNWMWSFSSLSCCHTNSWTWFPHTSTSKRRSFLDWLFWMTSMWIIPFCVCVDATKMCGFLIVFCCFAVVSVSGCRWTAGFWTMTFQRRLFLLPSASWSGNSPSSFDNRLPRRWFLLRVESILQLVNIYWSKKPTVISCHRPLHHTCSPPLQVLCRKHNAFEGHRYDWAVLPECKVCRLQCE